MKIFMSNVCKIYGLPESIKKELKILLTKVNPQYYMLRNIKNVSKEDFTFRLYKEDGDTFIFPRGEILKIIDVLKKRFDCKIIDGCSQGNEIEINGNLYDNLDDFQKEAIDNLVNKRQSILLSPTGSGKTLIMAGLIEKLKLSSLIVVHNSLLRDQWRNVFKKYFNYKCGLYGYGEKEIKDITISTIQSLWRLSNEQILEMSERFGIVVFDECHKVPARQIFRVANQMKCKYRFGVTGTVKRKDGLDFLIESAFGRIYSVDESEVKRIMNPEVHVVILPKLFYLYSSWHSLVECISQSKTRNEIIVENVKEYVKYGPNLVVVDRISHAKLLYDMLRMNVPTGLILGEVDIETREEIKRKILSGEIKVLVATRNIISEGVDIPNLSVLHLVIPTSNNLFLEQIVGRIRRISPGKKYSIIIDYVDQDEILYSMFVKRRSFYKKKNWMIKYQKGEFYE
ncbi:MAG: DEAD/DEAH box helicase [Candidatus Aenigmatarchaeota archaeon]